MNYDEYLNAISKSKKDDLKYMALVSILPFFPLSIKLMTRKNNGKKPFSNEFKFEEKVNQIKELDKFVKEQLDVCNYETTLKSKLKSFVEILCCAMEQINNIGLKNDFKYMINETNSIIDLI